MAAALLIPKKEKKNRKLSIYLITKFGKKCFRKTFNVPTDPVKRFKSEIMEDLF